MLILVFKADQGLYALPCGQVVECIPGLKPTPIPRAPEYVTGTIVYRGEVVPVVDLGKLIGGKSSPGLFSTRLIVVRYPLGTGGKSAPLALLAQEVVSYSEFDPEGAAKFDGLMMPDAKYLGKLYKYRGEMLQFIQVHELLTPEARETLFSRAGQEGVV